MLSNKTYFLIPHLGLGDIIWNIALVNYLSQSNNVELVCYQHNADNIKYIFRNNPKVTLYIIINNNEIIPRCGCNIEKFNSITQNKQVILNGNNKPPHNYDTTTFPFFFYDGIGYDRNILKHYFYLDNTERGEALYNKIKNLDYIFICNLTSYGEIFDIKTECRKKNINIDNLLVICSNKNIYGIGHKFYDLAQQFVYNKNNLLILDYKQTIENANKIMTTDSAMFCFIVQLKLKSNESYLYIRKCYTNFRWHDIFKFYNLNFTII